jgi:hypothetical protein
MRFPKKTFVFLHPGFAEELLTATLFPFKFQTQIELMS